MGNITISRPNGCFWHVSIGSNWIASFESKDEARMYKEYIENGGNLVPNYFNSHENETAAGKCPECSSADTKIVLSDPRLFICNECYYTEAQTKQPAETMHIY